MYEINKLRSRLGNISKHAKEYRMTVSEANALLAEIDELSAPIISSETVPAKEEKMQTVRIIDGGTF